MKTVEWVQLGAAVAAALAAAASWRAVREARRQSQTAREALYAQTQPLLAHVPFGSSAAKPGRDPGALSLGVADDGHGRPVYSASVPFRNVGNGTARIERVEFEAQGERAEGTASTLVLAPGERATALIGAREGTTAPVAAVAESIAAVLSDFVVNIDYADAASHHRGRVHLRVANGQYPHVAETKWED